MPISTLIAKIIIHQNTKNYKSKNAVIAVLGDKILLKNIFIFYKFHNFRHEYGKSFPNIGIIYAICPKVFGDIPLFPDGLWEM